MKKTLIIANGILPPKNIVEQIVSTSDYIICADGGANTAKRFGVQPDIILGDMDSISMYTRKHFHRVPFLFIPDQTSTDLEKALDYCIKQRISKVDVLGGIGSRTDHTTGTLGCFKKYGSKLHLRIFDMEGVITLIRKKVVLKMIFGEKLSLIPLDRCTGVTTKKLKYKLSNAVLELGVAEGISNAAEAKRVSISVKTGTLLLYRFYSYLTKQSNDRLT